MIQLLATEHASNILQFLPDQIGSHWRLVGQGEDHRLRQWSAPHLKPQILPETPGHIYRAISMHPNRQVVALGCVNAAKVHGVELFESKTFAPKALCRLPIVRPIQSLAFDPLGRFLLAVSAPDRKQESTLTVLAIDPELLDAQTVIHCEVIPGLQSVHWLTPDQLLLATETSLERREIVAAVTKDRISLPGPVRALAVRTEWGHPRLDYATYATGNSVHLAHLWPLAIGRCLGSHKATVTALDYSCSAVVASGCQEGTVKLWSQDGERASFPLGLGPVRHLRFSPDGITLAASAERGVVVLDVDVH